MADPVHAPEEADAPGGSTWFRAHADGRFLADLRWLGQQYRIMVFALPERRVLADECCTEMPVLARTRADRCVQEVYPHDCDAEGCAPWVRYSEA
jgi:hypothetical protein